MARAIERLRSGFVVGHAALGLHGDVPGSVNQQVHDGDTVTVRALGNMGVRFLGMDTPEISFTLPGQVRFVGLSDPKWEAFLTDPFAHGLAPFDPPLDPGLLEYLKAKVGPGTAANHHRHSVAAEKALEREITNDMEELGQSGQEFRFFLSFAREIMDDYGRLLCFLNRDQPPADGGGPGRPSERPLSYNERQLRNGMANPYFIWPNLNPFLRQKGSLVSAVVEPGKGAELAREDRALRSAREWVKKAREDELGIHEKDDPLRLDPSELRILARRRPPDRWVIDLTSDDDVLIRPQNYHAMPNPEDRLFVPAEYVPLFVERGWRRQEEE